MGGLILLSLLGVGAVAALIDAFSSDDDNSSSDDDTSETTEDEGLEIFTDSLGFTDDELEILGTDYDDSVAGTDLTSRVISLGAGDDLVLGEQGDVADVDTGSGDDLIDIDQAFETTITAGPGDDTIRGDEGWHAVTLDAGAGDDVIDVETYAADIWGDDYDAGAGDDTIRLRHHTVSSLGTIDVTLGEGADTFHLELVPIQTGPENLDEAVVAITDFVVGEDVLRIDPIAGSSAPGIGNLGSVVFQNSAIVESGAGTEIVLNYVQHEGGSTPGLGYTATIMLLGVSGLTADDFEITSS